MADVIVTTLRLMGQRAYISGMHQAASATQRVGYQSRQLGLAGRSAARGLGAMEAGILGATAMTAQLGAGLAVLGGYAVKTGVEFNAGMERATIGMKTLLGSGKEARQMVADVTAFAVKTPLFGIEEMTQAAQQLIGTGFESKKIVPTLETFSDTLSALGRKPEDLLRMRYAFTQMMNKGKISAEELRGQLGEIFPAQRILAREMGISTAKMSDKMKEGGLEAKKSIRLLLRGMAEDYGGATERMNKTFTGQSKQLQEGTKVMLGNMTKRFTSWLSRDMLPELNRFVSAMSDAWDPKKKMNLEQRLNRTKQLVKIILGPIARDIGEKIRKAKLGQKLVGAIDRALPKILNKLAELGGQAVVRFAAAWWDAGPAAKLFVLTLFAAKLGIFSTIGGMATDKFVTGFGNKWRGSKTKTKMTGLGRTAGRWIGAGLVAGVLLAVPDIVEIVEKEVLGIQPGKGAVGQYSGGAGWKELGKDIAENVFGGFPSLGIPGTRQTGGRAAGRGWTITGERGPEMVRLPAGANIFPTHSLNPAAMGMGGAIQVNSNLYLDGKLVAKNVAHHTANDLARR